MNRAAAALLLAAAAAAQAPQLQLSTPAAGSVDVDWQRQELQLQFDRAMAPATRFRAGDCLPRITASEWLDARTLRLSVVLDPESVYALELVGAGGGAGFAGRDGAPLPATRLCFATRSAEPRPAEQLLARNQLAFDRLVVAVRDAYAYRDRLGIDWRERFDQHRPAMLAAPTLAALALATAELLAVADDPQVGVRYGRALLPTARCFGEPNFDAAALQRTLPGLRPLGSAAATARTADGIGYLRIDRIDRLDRLQFDGVIEALRQLRDCRGLVLDLRLLRAADEELARLLAAWFVRGRRVYAAQLVRQAALADGFEPRLERSLRGNAPPDRFDGPVAVLTGPAVMAGGEALLLMLRQASQVRLCGEASAGSCGNPKPHLLAPGLSVLLPSWRALRPDGTCFEGEGIVPDLAVPTTAADFTAGDPVLQRALQWLRAP